MAKPFRMSLPAISKHLRVLEEANLIHRQRDGREHRIRANTNGLKVAQKWIAQYVELWETRFDALDELLSAEPQKGKSP